MLFPGSQSPFFNSYEERGLIVFPYVNYIKF